MTFDLRGPGAPYHLLFDDDTTLGQSLPQAFQAIYGGDWRLPDAGAWPYTFANFVVSRDGRSSFNDPQHTGGGDISRGARHDKWLMALLRARADAVLVGNATLHTALSHRWTPEAVFRPDAAAFAALRAHEQRALAPLLVIVTRSGAVPATAAVLRAPQQPVLIATTVRGAEQAQQLLGQHDAINYHVTAANDVDLAELAGVLRTRYNVATLLCEGGARTYGALVQARMVNDEFLTVSPIVVGNPPSPSPARPGLIEGTAFDQLHPPQVDLLTLRRHESYLFQRSRYRPGDAHATHRAGNHG